MHEFQILNGINYLCKLLFIYDNFDSKYSKNIIDVINNNLKILELKKFSNCGGMV
jgi:hypothetical protein